MSAERFTDLETRLAFLEASITELSDLVYDQQRGMDELRTWCRTLAGRLEALREGEGGQDGHEPPPHY